MYETMTIIIIIIDFRLNYSSQLAQPNEIRFFSEIMPSKLIEMKPKIN